jgi:hypothetical protein
MDPYLKLLVVALIILVIPLWILHLRRSRELVGRWAAQNAYTVQSIERRYLRAGPFFWRRGRGHEVFRVVVRTTDGGLRGGYVRTGGWFLGQISDKVVVHWD